MTKNIYQHEIPQSDLEYLTVGDLDKRWDYTRCLAKPVSLERTHAQVDSPCTNYINNLFQGEFDQVLAL